MCSKLITSAFMERSNIYIRGVDLTGFPTKKKNQVPRTVSPRRFEGESGDSSRQPTAALRRLIAPLARNQGSKISHCSMDSSVAPVEDDAATLATIPGDALGVVQQFLGFHSSPAVSVVSTSLYKTEELEAARARQRLSLAAMPSLPSGPRNLRDCRLATEYLSLVPTTEGVQSRTIICAQNYHCDDEQSLAAVLQRSCTRCVLRTSTDQGCKYTFIVEINKDAGEVLVRASQ